jgi:fucose permease
MAIVGGAIMPPIHGLASDRLGTAPPSVVAAICYLGVFIYAIFNLRAKDRFADIPEQEPKIEMTGH